MCEEPENLNGNQMSWLNPRAWVPTFPPQLWLKTSHKTLERAEKKILSGVWDAMEHKYVPIQNKSKFLRTVSMNKIAKKTPLVLVHGMGSGVGLWILNYEALCKHRPVHAFDMLGFGRSSRPTFSKNGTEAEVEFVESMEEWRKQMGFDKFVILGHSLGGFLAASYALKYPERIRHLILADPWGFPLRPTDPENKRFQFPWYVKAVGLLISPFNPLSTLRILGPWGPTVVNLFRQDIVKKFGNLYEDDTVAQYIYHCNAQTPSGEVAFKALSDSFAWAKNPMMLRIADLPAHVPITMIYGSRTWMDINMGWHIKYKRPNSYVDIRVVKGAGHHVYADRAQEFNTVVNRICNIVDQEFDLLTRSPIGAYKQLRRYSESQTDRPRLRRRTRSECPLDSYGDAGSKMRKNFTFTGVDQFVEECDTNTEHPAETSSVEQENDAHLEEPVTFSVAPEQS